MAAQPEPLDPNPLREALRQRGGAAGSRRAVQERRSRSLTYSTGTGGNRRHTIGGAEAANDSQPDGPASQEGQDLKWLNLQAFAPKALLGVLDSFKTEDIATTAKELGEQGYSLVQELSRPRQKPKSRPSGQPSKGDGVLRLSMQGRGGIVLPDHLAAARQPKDAAPEEVNASGATQVDLAAPEPLDAPAPSTPVAATPEVAEGTVEAQALDTVESATPADGGKTMEDVVEEEVVAKDEAATQGDRGTDGVGAEVDESQTPKGQQSELAGEPSSQACDTERRTSHDFAPPSRSSRPSWLKDDSPQNSATLNTPSGSSGGASGTGVRDMRDFWNKKSVGYAGASENGKRRLSKSEAQAALQRLVSAGSAMDFEQVRELRKLAGGTQTEMR